MAIESVFTKLQNNRRKQYEDIAKRQSREAAVGAFSNVAGKFLGTVLNDTLREKTNNFINSAPIMNERIQAKIADDRKRRIGGIQNQIDSSGKSTFEFMFDQHLPSFEEGYRAELAEREGEEGWRDFAANPDVFDADIRSRLTEIITPLAENHDEAYALSQRVGTYEDFNATVELASKNAKPTSVMGLLSRELRGAISGKSRQDFEDEAFLAIQNGPLAQNAAAFNTFMEQYEQNKDVVKAAKFTEFVHELEAPTDRKRVDEVQSITSVGTGANFRLIEQTVTTETDIFTKEKVTTVSDPEVIFDATKDNPVLAANQMREMLQNNVNYKKDVLADFSATGQNEFATRVQAAGYNTIGDYTTFEQWETEGEIFTDMMQNPEYVINPLLMAKRQAGYDLIVDDGVEIQRLIQSLTAGEMTQEEYETAVAGLFDRVLLDMADFDRRTGPTPYESL
jgi:hypothetical protein